MQHCSQMNNIQAGISRGSSILLSDFCVIKRKAHVAVPGQSKLVGLLQHRWGHGSSAQVLEVGSRESVWALATDCLLLSYTQHLGAPVTLMEFLQLAGSGHTRACEHVHIEMVTMTPPVLFTITGIPSFFA